ncbi:MAG: redoxin domain-containing protein [Chloroflexi bacterium]|nr:redoxin domain-containing protein [Chloroflexota bacterium]
MIPQVGDAAPDFRLASTADGELALSSLRGRKAIILFYVLDFTGG